MARVVTHRKRRDPFVRIEREVMEDPTLSFKAKALYGWLLDKGEFPGGWDTDVGRISAITTDGAFAIRGALEELVKANRLVRVDTGSGGRGKRAEWHIYDEPKPTENREVKDELTAETAPDERGNRDLTPHYSENSLSETREGASRKRKTQLPNDFELTEERRARALARRVPSSRVEHEFEQFKNWHLAHGSLMLDWDAAWRTWAGKYSGPLDVEANGNGFHPDVQRALDKHGATP